MVVCYRRAFNPNSEQAVPVNLFWDSIVEGGGFVALAGGNVRLQVPQVGGANNINVRENNWVALCNPAGVCRWYRVLGVNDNTAESGTPSQYGRLGWPVPIGHTRSIPRTGQIRQPRRLRLPDGGGDMVVALGQEVVGVYTTTVDLDTDATWKN